MKRTLHAPWMKSWLWSLPVALALSAGTLAASCDGNLPDYPVPDTTLRLRAGSQGGERSGWRPPARRARACSEGFPAAGIAFVDAGERRS